MLKALFHAGLNGSGLHSTAPCLLLAVFAFMAFPAYAAQPVPYTAQYEARYGGFKASAERSLIVSETNQIEMSTALKLKLLGKSISSITEQSILVSDPANHQYRPVEYSFQQSGIGKRQRHTKFDWDSGMAFCSDDKNTVEIPIQDTIADNLSSFLEVNNQLQHGKQDIFFPVMDKGVIEEMHFKVLAEEIIETRLGNFRTIKIERVREADSNRTTEMWLALDWDYLLVKLEQHEKGKRNISLELKQASVNNVVITSDSSQSTSGEEQDARLVRD